MTNRATLNVGSVEVVVVVVVDDDVVVVDDNEMIRMIRMIEMLEVRESLVRLTNSGM